MALLVNDESGLVHLNVYCFELDVNVKCIFIPQIVRLASKFRGECFHVELSCQRYDHANHNVSAMSVVALLA